MDYRVFEDKIFARFDKGDEIISGITEICKSENIKTASISGIGGCGEVVVGTYVLDKKDYSIQQKTGLFEMISLSGNITLKDNEPFVHAHSLFSYLDDNGNSNLIGGHLKKAIVLLTAEIVISTVTGIIKRSEKDENGICIWNF